MSIGGIGPGVINDLLGGSAARKLPPGGGAVTGLPIDNLLGSIAAKKPGVVTGLPVDGLFGTLAGVKNKQADVQQMRAELGAVRSELAADMQTLRDKGPGLPPQDMKAIMARVEKNMARATDLQNRLIAANPQLALVLTGLRQQRDALNAAQYQAIKTLHTLHADPKADPKAVAKAESVVQELALQQARLTATLDKALGVPGPGDMLRSQLQNTFNEIGDIKARLAMPFPPMTKQYRQQLEDTVAKLNARVGDLKQRLTTELGQQDPGKAKELQARMQEQTDLTRKLAGVRGELARMGPPSFVNFIKMAPLQAQAAAIERQMQANAGKMDELLGLKPPPGQKINWLFNIKGA